MTTELQRRLDLTTRMNEFLKVRVLSHGGYAPVSEADLKALAQLIRDLIGLKWGADPDGDVPVEVDLVDRTRFERLHFWPMPYTHKGDDANEMPAFERALDVALYNLSVAAGKVETAHLLIRHKRAASRPRPRPVPSP